MNASSRALARRALALGCITASGGFANAAVVLTDQDQYVVAKNCIGSALLVAVVIVALFVVLGVGMWLLLGRLCAKAEERMEEEVVDIIPVTPKAESKEPRGKACCCGKLDEG